MVRRMIPIGALGPTRLRAAISASMSHRWGSGSSWWGTGRAGWTFVS